MSPHSSASPDELRRHALVLSKLAAAPDQRLRSSELRKRLTTKAAKAVGFTPDVTGRAVEELAAAAQLRRQKAGRTEWVELTDEGRSYFGSLGEYLPAESTGRGKVNPPASDEVRRARVAYLLLQLLQAEGHALPAGAANKKTGQSDRLELNPATANHVRRELAQLSYLTIRKTGRSELFTLTDAGRHHLGTLSFYEAFEFKLSGRALNSLLESAREAAKQFEVTPKGAERSPPSTAELESSILSLFEELRRERHSVSGLVPIPEVRARVRDRFGPAAGRHDAFDEAVLGLWRAKRVRLTPIADRGKVTPEQLQDALPGVGETLYYLEAAREPVAV